MMDESVQHRDHRLSSLDRRGDERGGAVRLSGTVWAPSVLPFDCVAQHGSPLWASPDAPLTGRAPPRAETGHIALLTAIRRIVAAIRVRRGRARSRQQLRARRPPAQGHWSQTRGCWTRIPEAALALGLSLSDDQ